MATVTSSMSFLEPWPSTDKKESPYLRHVTEENYPSTNFTNNEHTVTITDARPQKSSFSVDKHGFAFTDTDTPNDEVLRAIRTKEGKPVQEKYYPVVEELVKKNTGASRVVIFDHTYRKRDPVVDMKVNPYARGQPATVVHCDQSAWGAERRVHKHTGDDAEQLLKGRCQILNVWRPLSGPVTDWPLAVMNYQTLSPSHIHPTSLFSIREELQGQTVGINYSPDQRWYYLEKQRPDEVTLVKIWDNKEDVSRLCAHCAFQHPHMSEGGVPRESIEVRCLVFYDDMAQA